MDQQSFLQYLDSVHARTRRVIELIPPEQLEWAPAPGKFSFGDIVRHLANIERFMYAESVSGRPSAYTGHDRRFADGYGAVVAYYDRMHDASRAIFAALTPDTIAKELASRAESAAPARLMPHAHSMRRARTGPDANARTPACR